MQLTPRYAAQPARSSVLLGNAQPGLVARSTTQLVCDESAPTAPIVTLTNPGADGLGIVGGNFTATATPGSGSIVEARYWLDGTTDLGVGTLDVDHYDLPIGLGHRGAHTVKCRALNSRGLYGDSAIKSFFGLRARRDAMGASLSGSGKWSSGAWGVDGKLYSAPTHAGNILIVDPVAFTATRSTMGASTSGSWMWNGQVAASNGMIYGVPFDTSTILRIDPTAGTATNVTMGASLSGSGKWIHGVEAPNGKIYCFPWDTSDILIIDVATETATRSNMGASLSGGDKWQSGCLAPNGKIYCPPASANDFLVIDPSAGTATRTTLGLTLSGADKYRGAVLAADGKIYCVPGNTTQICVIDPATDTATLTLMGLPALLGQWYGGVLLPDGRILCCPFYSSSTYYALLMDPANGTAHHVTLGLNLTAYAGWMWQQQGWNGAIIGVPYNATDILMID